jgi:hypothetical protein
MSNGFAACHRSCAVPGFDRRRLARFISWVKHPDATCNRVFNPIGRVPRVARLLAVARRFDELVQTGVAADYADLARLGHVTRARVTQIMNLLSLAPDIQEQILCRPAETSGKVPISERGTRGVVAELD